MKSFLKLFVCAMAMLLAGCQTPIHRGVNEALTSVQSLDDRMSNRNVAMVVAITENSFKNYQNAVRNYLYLQGVDETVPEARYRIAYLFMRNTDWALHIGVGERVWPMAAYVPDHIPQLEDGDVVEVRMDGDRFMRRLKDFSTTGEGTAIVRVLCKFKDPDFARCINSTPRIEHYQGFGETGTLFPASLKEYGFTFTPFYDDNGDPIRSHVNE